MTPTRGTTPGSVVQKWDRDSDVVIIGYGGSGAVAAIEAHDAGADVLILESTEEGGGNTIVSFGSFLCPTNVEEAITYLTALFDLSLSEKDEDLIRVFAEESVHNVEWITGLKEGTTVHVHGGAGYPMVKGAHSMKKYVVHGEGKGITGFAENLFNLLRYAVEDRRQIPILTQTAARRLVTGSSGEIIGVIAESGGKEIAIKAKRAVVLTTGGYAGDMQTLQNHVKGFPVYNLGHPGNKGDGLRMAQKVGAGLWHMNGVSCGFGLKVPEFESAFAMHISRKAHIFVDKTGNRFINEVDIENHAGLLIVDYYNTHTLEYPRIPFYAIFDETVRRKGKVSKALGVGAAGVQYEWSKDNSVEIEKGWIKKGETLKALAEGLDINPENLEKSVDRWNQQVNNGDDTDFGRKVGSDATIAQLQNTLMDTLGSQEESDKSELLIETPPFYAVEIHPALINTQGGPRRNGNSQVLDPFGEPIPHLYSAGELGSMWGLIYQGAGNIGECIVFGRIAGRNSAGEQSLA
jgi:succinate dehydrogenase/fumarate reductase flavoprotein subunit